MAGTTTWRHRAAILGVVALAAFTLGGCAKKNPPVDNASSPGVGQLGGSPSSSATTTGAGTPAPTTKPPGPRYPGDAKSYGYAFLSAWAAKDYDRLLELAVPSAEQQVKDSVEAQGVPNTNWHFIRCDAGGDSQSCTYRNDNGDETVLKLSTQQLGHPLAVLEAPLERTVFAKAAPEYVNDFVSAWQKGNQQRMLAYSNQTVLNFAKAHTVVQGYTLLCINRTGSTFVTVSGLGVELGVNYEFEVNLELVGAGKKHSIVTASTHLEQVGPC